MSAPLEIQEDTILVILGASGDLAKKKLVGSNSLMPTFSPNHFTQFPALFGLVRPHPQPPKKATTPDNTLGTKMSPPHRLQDRGFCPG